MYNMSELREIDQHKTEPFDSDVNVVYVMMMYDVSLWKLIQFHWFSMYERNYACSVFALEKHVHIAWSEMKMAQVIDIQS